MRSTLSLNRGKIVNDESLILYLDAANPESYSGSGNKWYDLTQYKQEITLFNSPTFNNSGAGYGSLQLNGSNQFASGSLSPGLTSLPYTVSTWIYCGGGVNNLNPWINLESFFSGIFVLGYNSPFGAFYFNIYGGELVAYPGTINGGYIYNFWGNLTYVIERYTSSSLLTNTTYLNGKLIYIDSVNYTNPLTPPFSNKIKIGASFVYPNDYFSGSISTVQIYNRALSSDEVLQNYNALKISESAF